MLYILICMDGPNGAALRAGHRPAHLRYLKDAGDRVKLAGPLLSNGDDPHPIGSLILIDAASEAAVKLFAASDPYCAAGVFSDVTIRPFKPVMGDWMPEALSVPI